MTTKKIPENIVDFHVHLFPDKLFEAIWNHFVKDYGWKVIHRLYYRQCIEYLENRGVTRIIYCNYAHKLGVARGLNDWNLKVLDEYDTICCFAAFHPLDPDAIDMARDLLTHPRILGFKLQFLVTDFYPWDKKMLKLYELVMEHNKRLLLHIGTGPVASPYVGLAHFKKVLKIYPDLPVNVAHMGGMEYKGFLNLLDKHENLIFDTSFSFLPGDGVHFDQGREALEKYKDKIVYGSDFPNLILPRAEEINCLADLDLSQEFYDKVFWENGISLLPEIS